MQPEQQDSDLLAPFKSSSQIKSGMVVVIEMLRFTIAWTGPVTAVKRHTKQWSGKHRVSWPKEGVEPEPLKSLHQGCFQQMAHSTSSAQNIQLSRISTKHERQHIRHADNSSYVFLKRLEDPERQYPTQARFRCWKAVRRPP